MNFEFIFERYRIAGNFRGSKNSWFSNIVGSWFIYFWLLLALQVKVGKVASFVGKIFFVQYSNEYFAPRKLPAICQFGQTMDYIAHGPRPKNDALTKFWTSFEGLDLSLSFQMDLIIKSYCTKVMAVERCSTTCYNPLPPLHLINGSGTLSAAIT